MSTGNKIRQYGSDEAVDLWGHERWTSHFWFMERGLTEVLKLIARALQQFELLIKPAFPTLAVPEHVF
jgi:hypothetical protein